jgi:hypothetical protein
MPSIREDAEENYSPTAILDRTASTDEVLQAADVVVARRQKLLCRLAE